ncbi:MAG: hypothetical protein JXR19_11005 [Bacteroidia bacterium]
MHLSKLHIFFVLILFSKPLLSSGNPKPTVQNNAHSTDTSTRTYDSLLIGTKSSEYLVLYKKDKITVKTSDSIFNGIIKEFFAHSMVIENKNIQHRVAFEDVEIIKVPTIKISRKISSYLIGGIGGFLVGFGIAVFPSAVEYDATGIGAAIIGAGGGLIIGGYKLSERKFKIGTNSVIIPPMNN